MSQGEPADRRLRDQREEEAARWHVRLASDRVSEADFIAFEGWVAVAENRAAYDAQDRLSVEIDDAAAALRGAVAEAADSLLPRRAMMTRGAWLAGSLALAAAAAFVIVLSPRSEPQRWTTFVAPTDAPRVVVLDDGSTAHLNRGASIGVAITKQSREVNLAAGEVAFDVVHDADRSFSVAVGEDRIEDVGTEFNVLRAGNRTTVTVRQGAVSISPLRSRKASGGIRLDAGDQYTHEQGTAPVIARRIDTKAAFSWQNGHLIYNDASLAQVVGDLNRYFDRKVRIDGDHVGALRFSGVITIDSEDRVVERLKALLPIDVSNSEEEVVLHEKRKR